MNLPLWIYPCCTMVVGAAAFWLTKSAPDKPRRESLVTFMGGLLMGLGLLWLLWLGSLRAFWWLEREEFPWIGGAVLVIGSFIMIGCLSDQVDNNGKDHVPAAQSIFKFLMMVGGGLMIMGICWLLWAALPQIPVLVKDAINWAFDVTEEPVDPGEWPEGVPLPTDIEGLKIAAENGFPNAQFELGRRYAEGDGTPVNPAEAVEWWRKSASQGYAQAEYRLGLALLQGDGVDPAPPEGIKWLRRAAEQGVTDAMHRLGKALAAGEGILENDLKANEWFLQAARKGQVKSQFQVGINYLYGEVVSQDRLEAYAWFNIAAARGNLEARKQKEILAEQMDKFEIERAQERSRELQQEFVNPESP